ncbi:MAG: 2-oxo acid dehydrogenase subunit E2 [Bacilli bacterium]|nr:2-oxo acid dehydrogenase subunit E2 [Bacilli bacterium]
MGRKDARRVKNINGMEQLMLDIKPSRADSDVFLKQDYDVTKLVNFVDKAKKEGKEYTYFHAFVTAIAKTIYNRPKLNRFIANRHVYEHNDVVISFVAKVSFEDQAEEVMLLIPIEVDDNIESICEKIKTKVKNIREKKVEKEGANSAIDTLGKLPNIIRVPLVGLLKWMDKKGILPASLMKDNLYYSSTIVTDIGTFGCSAIYHNITDFGACSSILAIGEIRDKEILEKGKSKKIKAVDLGLNFDERIADGFYLIKSAKLLEYFFDNPETLEEPVSKQYKLDK